MRSNAFLLFREARWHESDIANAFRTGLARLGWQETGEEAAQVLITWGMRPGHREVRQRFERAGKPVLVVDYPYWNRGGGKYQHGYYRITTDGLHPPQHFMDETLSADRYRATGGPEIQPWQSGGHFILLAGMGPKGAAHYGQAPHAWDTAAVRAIRRVTSREIMYRQKPSSKLRHRIRGTTQADETCPLTDLFPGCHALVTHHGNAALEALAAGIPVFVADGPAASLGCTDLSAIEQPVRPAHREAFFHNLAHWQWSLDDIRAGLPLTSYVMRGYV